jgi:hypothetical protein
MTARWRLCLDQGRNHAQVGDAQQKADRYRGDGDESEGIRSEQMSVLARKMPFTPTIWNVFQRTALPADAARLPLIARGPSTWSGARTRLSRDHGRR